MLARNYGRIHSVALNSLHHFSLALSILYQLLPGSTDVVYIQELAFIQHGGGFRNKHSRDAIRIGRESS
jgi:hypothetical protein